jgi:Tfp pilus assembly protein PilW
MVELLVALVITVILVLILTSVVAATLSAWTHGRNRLDLFQRAPDNQTPA